MMLPAVTVAGALALAGCGGGGGTGPVVPCGDGETRNAAGTCVPDGPSAAETAAEAITAANAAVMALTDSATTAQILDANALVTTAQLRIDALPEADQAAEDAKLATSITRIAALAADRKIVVPTTMAERISRAVGDSETARLAAASISTAAQTSNGRLTLLTSQGDSSAVKENAEAVRDAPEKIRAEIAKAKAEETKLQAMLDALPTGASAETKKPISDALASVKADLTEMEALVEVGGTLVRNSVAITEKGAGSPEIRSRDVAREVRTLIAALTPGSSSTDNTPSVDGVTDGAFPVPSASIIGRAHNAPDSMMTFAQIYADQLTDQQQSVRDASELRPAISLQGKSIAGFFTSGTTLPDQASATGADGVVATLASGIQGLIIRRGSDAVARPANTAANFGAGWYFVPGASDSAYSPRTRYAVGSDGRYALARWVDYGMWLGQVSSADAIAFRVQRGAGSAALGSTYATGADRDLDDGTATYQGAALGISARTDPANGRVMGSGRFDADVEITARFGTAPTFDGTIDNFRPPEGETATDAIDPSWKLEWKQHTFPPSGSTTANGNFRTHGTTDTGSWEATAYGADVSARPDGFHGGFHNDFLNGNVAGVFATDSGPE